jgi:hypothetical protein
MKWTARVEKSAFLRDEPVVVRLAFVDDETARSLPLEPNVLDVLTFELFDEDGRLLREANGYTWEERLGNQVMPGDPTKLPSARLEAGAPVEWTEDLLAYVGVLEPGRYGVRVGFRYEPSGIDVWSDRVDFRVTAPDVARVDVVADQVAVPVLHSIQLERRDDGSAGAGESEGEVGGLVHFRLASDPRVHWEGQVFPGDPRASWTAAVSDFTSVESFAHDYSRWWVAVVEDELQGVKVRSKAEPIRASVSLGREGLGLFARPVQRSDGGCSIVLFARAGESGGVTILRVGFSPDGQIVEELRLVADGDCDCGVPLASGVASDGRIVVVTAGEDGRPSALVWLTGESYTEEALELARTLPPEAIGGAFEPLSVRVDTRRRYPGGDRLQLTGMIVTPRGPEVWAAWREIGGGSGSWSHVGVGQQELAISPDEVIVWADSLLDRNGSLWFLARTSSGRCMLWSKEGGAKVLCDGVEHLPQMPRLVDCGGHLHVADARPGTGVLFFTLL